jgi:hypothetical protein
MPGVSDEPAASRVVPRVATFFSLYPEPLGLANGTHYCVVMKSPVRGFVSKVALHLKEGEAPVYLDPRFHELLYVSVRFHQVTRQQSLYDENTSQLWRVVEAVGGPHFRPATPGAADADVKAMQESSSVADSASVYTVVEMTTPIVIPRETHWDPCLPTDDVIGPTRTRCLDELMHIVNAYRFAQKILIPAPARERIGPIIIEAIRPANPDDGGWETTRELINSFALPRQPSLKAEQRPDTMRAMTHYFLYENLGHPSIALANLQNEMDVALYHDGNFRGTVMSAHSASEVLLDAALTAMLFEEARTPETAANVFDNPLKTRLLKEYHERLGGAWAPQGSNAVAVWLRDLLSLRHRVAHAGYMPSSGEATAAREAYYTLGRHLRDRLAAQVKKYPFTAGMLVSRGGFERRNIRTKAASGAVAAVSGEALTKFASWRADLVRVRAGTP